MRYKRQASAFKRTKTPVEEREGGDRERERGERKKERKKILIITIESESRSGRGKPGKLCQFKISRAVASLTSYVNGATDINLT